MNFLKTVGNSIHSPEFYSKVTKQSFKQSFVYFLLLALILTLLRTITAIVPLFNEAPKALQNFAAEIKDCYPKDLEINVINGQASSSAKEPVFISCKDAKPLLVIDTQTPYSSNKFDEYKTDVWITKDTIFYKKSDLETRSYSLSKLENFKLNKEVLNNYYDKFLPYLKFVGPLLLFLAFLGNFLMYDARLIYLLFAALLIFLLTKSFKQNLSYGSAYKVGLHAITLGLIVELVLNLTYRWTHISGFPFMVTVLILAVVFVNLIQPKKDKS